MVAADTQASFTEGSYAEAARLELKTAEHSGGGGGRGGDDNDDGTEASERRPGGFFLCLFFLVGSETQALVRVGRVF